MPGNTDDLIAQMEADELADRMELGKMSPIEYAKAKKIQPQLVYYYIRTGKIKVEMCVCGRKVIDVPSADAYLKEKEASDNAKNGRVVVDESEGVS